MLAPRLPHLDIGHGTEVQAEVLCDASACLTKGQTVFDFLCDLWRNLRSGLDVAGGMDFLERGAAVYAVKPAIAPSPRNVGKGSDGDAVLGTKGFAGHAPGNVITKQGSNLICGVSAGFATETDGAVHHILTAAARPKVARVDASWIIAPVKDVLPLWYGAISVGKRKSVRQRLVEKTKAPTTEHAVTLVVLASGPLPAFIRFFDVHFGPESFIKHMLSFRGFRVSIAG